MKPPTQFDVAKRAGVSRTTVSFVLNGVRSERVPISEETRVRVLEAIEELGYVPNARARALRSGDTKTLSLIMPDFRNPHFWEIAEGVEQEARDAGYNLLVSNIPLKTENVNEIFTDLSHQRVDGLILIGSFTSNPNNGNNSLGRFLKRRLPIVELSDHYSLRYEIDRVSSNYYDTTIEAMSYLLSLHHRRIGLLYGAAVPELIEDRFQPYQESLLAAGLPVEEELIIHCEPTIEGGYQATSKLLQLPERPTAIIAINDLLAIGAIRAISDAGLRNPEDISLLGYDDIAMSNYLVPRLTTVSKDISSLGRIAVKLLLARIQEPDRPYQIEHSPARLIIRESTGPSPY
jgi:LacI family transcriptional regulator